ncbi:methylated-DNA--[protein]-cysteine S-methyltransferase [Paenibacillus silvisoli]|uniref:methylated-DNA--[protein]-cysteine S-methyltransferase n=1 Tax=Paenibacillus silvisoli TaxID=3110539 RepID=UPI002805AACC|nr:methylated-DNA--[protein]-cysteine S-methyltransferase [Paenibacillus silvisoli]
MTKKLFWTKLQEEAWNLHLVATEEGLCYVGSPDVPFDEAETWCKKHFPAYELERDDERMAAYGKQLIDYLGGKLTGFELPLSMKGTEFQQSVWEALKAIPHGQTCSYSDIARQIGRPSAVRAVGTAIGANPVLIVVPCHRVVGKDGSLTGFRGGMKAKEQLLKLEGVL